MKTLIVFGWISLSLLACKSNPDPIQQARTWYLQEVSKIKKKNLVWIQSRIPLKTRAYMAFLHRKEARLESRKRMKNTKWVRALEKRDQLVYGNPHGPSFAFLVKKYKKRGYSQNAIYEKIIHGSQKTNPFYTWLSKW